MMNTKRTAFFVVVLAALAAWLAAAATSSVSPIRPVATAPAPIDLRGEALAAEVERLHDRLRPTAAPQGNRNLFQFSLAREPHAPVPAAAAPAPSPVVVAPIEPAFKLIGIAEDAGIRTAILASPGQLFMVKDGEMVASKFRVTAISADTVELADTADGHVLRLALK